MNKKEIKIRLASDELLAAALELMKNGELTPREKITMALQLDAREDILELKGNVDKINNHPLHKVTVKGVASIIGILLGLSALCTWVINLL